VCILNFVEVKVFLPVLALFRERGIAVTDFNPSHAAIVVDAGVGHVAIVFVAGDGALA
jgi:hypothetical protein